MAGDTVTADPPARKPRLRARGEGSVYQRADGRWVASIRLPDGTRGTRYRSTEKAALKELAALQEAIKHGLNLPDERLTLGDYLTAWLEGRKGALKDRTHERYAAIVARHITPALGKRRLLQLQPVQIRQHYSSLTAAGLAPRTVWYVHAVLHAALEEARRDGLVQRNVADLVQRPRAQAHEMQALTAEQARALLAAAAGDRLEALYVLALSTGMRQGELLGLRWVDVDLAAGQLAVRGSLQRSAAGLQIDSPKTRGSRRNISLTRGAVAALRRHQAAQAAEQAAASDWGTLGLVFTNELGRPLEAGNVLRRSFWPLLAKAKLPRIRFHDLRHTAATLMLSRGVHPKIASEMLGHSKVGITLDLYSHVTPTMQAQATAALDEALGGG